jgi:hypothetical protein
MLKLANGENYVKESPRGNGRRKNDAKPSVKDNGKNIRKPRRASWMNGNCVKPVVMRDVSGARGSAGVVSMRWFNITTDSIPARRSKPVVPTATQLVGEG